ELGTGVQTCALPICGSVVTAYRPTGATQLDVTLIASDSDRLDIGKLSAIPVGTGAAAGGVGAATTTTATSTTPTIVTLGQIATKIGRASGRERGEQS